jgi:hypothetical protein
MLHKRDQKPWSMYQDVIVGAFAPTRGHRCSGPAYVHLRRVTYASDAVSVAAAAVMRTAGGPNVAGSAVAAKGSLRATTCE